MTNDEKLLPTGPEKITYQLGRKEEANEKKYVFSSVYFSLLGDFLRSKIAFRGKRPGHWGTW